MHLKTPPAPLRGSRAISRSFRACALTFLLGLAPPAASPARADLIRLLGPGDWMDTGIWSGDTVPAKVNEEAKHSVNVGSGVSGTVLINGGPGSYKLQEIHFENTSSVTFRNSTNFTSNSVTLAIEEDFLKDGSGSVIFSWNTNGTIYLTIGGDLIINDGKVLFGTSSAYAQRLTVSGSTIINKGLLSMRTGSRGSTTSPVQLGKTYVGAEGGLELYTGGNSSLTTEYFRVQALSGSGKISVQNSSATLYSGVLTVDTAETNNLFSGEITQAGNARLGLAKTGTGSLTLSGSNSYTGGTGVEQGVLIAASDTALGTGEVAVGAEGRLRVEDQIILNNTIVLNGGTLEMRGRLSGSAAGISFGAEGGRIEGGGRIDVDAGFASLNQIIGAGTEAIEQIYGADQAWSSLTYEWGIKSWDEEPGSASLVTIEGDLELSLAGTYRLSLKTLQNEGGAGLLDNFEEVSRSWTILTATGEIDNFDAMLWEIDASGFLDAHGGSWKLGRMGSDLVLTYTAAIPEPGALGLFSGLVGAWAAFLAGPLLVRRGVRFPLLS